MKAEKFLTALLLTTGTAVYATFTDGGDGAVTPIELSGFAAGLLKAALAVGLFWAFDRYVLDEVDTVAELKAGNVAYALALLALAVLLAATVATARPTTTETSGDGRCECTCVCSADNETVVSGSSGCAGPKPGFGGPPGSSAMPPVRRRRVGGHALHRSLSAPPISNRPEAVGEVASRRERHETRRV